MNQEVLFNREQLIAGAVLVPSPLISSLSHCTQNMQLLGMLWLWNKSCRNKEDF